MHAQKVAKAWKDWEKQEKAIKAAKRDGKSKKQATAAAVSRAKREPGAKRGKAASKGLEEETKTSELLERPSDYTVNFEFNAVSELKPPVIELRDVGFRYGPEHPVLFKDVAFGIDTDTRAAIVGPNGVGKSTLLGLIMGDLEPTEGEILRNRFLRIGRYNQHFVDVLPMDKSPVDFLTSTYTVSYQAARNLLGRFGLGGHAHTIPLRDLSGGQKARVLFASLKLQDPHILFLDEPTNHLDIESIDALGEAIRAYDGGVVLVSHDSRLIRNAECRLWECSGRNCFEFDGDIDVYRERIIAELERIGAEEDARAAKRAEERAAARQEAAEARRKRRMERAKE